MSLDERDSTRLCPRCEKWLNTNCDEYEIENGEIVHAKCVAIEEEKV